MIAISITTNAAMSLPRVVMPHVRPDRVKVSKKMRPVLSEGEPGRVCLLRMRPLASLHLAELRDPALEIGYTAFELRIVRGIAEA